MSDRRAPLEDLDLGPDEADGDDGGEDAGLEDADETEDAGGADEGDVGDDDPEEVEAREEVRRPSRRDRQQQTWRQRLESDNAELRRRLDAFEGRAPQAPPVDLAAQQRADQEELARIALLPPDEATRELDRRNATRVAISELRVADRLDQTDWRQIMREDPAARRLADQVERQHAALRAQGMFNITREQVFNSLYGAEVRRQRTERSEKQRGQAQRRIQRQTVRPGSARGDVARSGQRERNNDEALLRGLRVGDL